MHKFTKVLIGGTVSLFALGAIIAPPMEKRPKKTYEHLFPELPATVATELSKELSSYDEKGAYKILSGHYKGLRNDPESWFLDDYHYYCDIKYPVEKLTEDFKVDDFVELYKWIVGQKTGETVDKLTKEVKAFPAREFKKNYDGYAQLYCLTGDEGFNAKATSYKKKLDKQNEYLSKLSSMQTIVEFKCKDVVSRSSKFGYDFDFSDHRTFGELTSGYRYHREFGLSNAFGAEMRSKVVCIADKQGDLREVYINDDRVL